ncbi:MAG TPA: T9SS type A sorting domain-containing protein, partial [Bacteroidia bacterium]|nr:T9SS type A sorting domain-containing protein [Bacteroidia bacterium]
NGCTGAATITISPFNCVGIDGAKVHLKQFVIYPNPSNGLFSFSATEAGSLIEIYDALGNLVYRTATTEKSTEIDLTKAAKGIYFVKISYRNGTVTEKVIRE